MCQRSKNSLKREYIRTTLDRHKQNPKKIWRAIRNFWPSKKQSSRKIRVLNGNQDSALIAEDLNRHFCTTGKRIQAKIDNPVDMPMFNPRHHPPIFDLKSVTDDEVANAISRLSSSRASGPDQITSFMLKSGRSAITPVLTHLFNLSLRKKSFPQSWKSAKVTPLYKSGPRDSPDNYRPISVLPTIGKVIERLVHSQCQKYLTENNILSEAQAGFREGRSTGTCLAQFLHNIYEGIDQGRAAGVLFLDLAKAFDSVDHGILLEKLRYLGFKPSSVTWFDSYLANRSQCTFVNNVCSTTDIVDCGVPQGSILGPLLFLCYINDLPDHLLYCTPSLYADDTALCYISDNVEDISSALNEEFHNVYQWFCRNKLSVNADKTECMLFRSRRKFVENCELKVSLNGAVIEQVSSFKYLGIHLDPLLSFDAHVDALSSKVKQRTRLLWKMRSFIPETLALDLYCSLIEPLFIYCCHLYDGCTKYNQHRLQILQNNALRAVKKVNMRYSATSLHDELSVEWLDTYRKQYTCTEAYKLVNGIGPSPLTSLFVEKVPTRVLRSNKCITLNHVATNTKFAENDFVFRAMNYWSLIPAHVQHSPNVEMFKSNLKRCPNLFEHIT